MPSARASSRAPAYTESSLLARTKPRSLRAAYRKTRLTGATPRPRLRRHHRRKRGSRAQLLDPGCAGTIVVSAAHGRNSIAVLPIRTGVPIGTRTAVVTFALSRYVPLVDPRSSTYHSEPRWDSRACRVEA